MGLGREDHGDGDPLVLLHGVATSRLIWRHVIGPLAATGRRVVTVDVPGFGESDPAGPGFELEDVADALVAGLAMERFDLVGHSLGGAVAVAAAARHPDRVDRLVLVSPAGLAPRAQGLAAALGAAAELAVHARRALGHPWVEHAAARRAMFGSTVADADRLDPDDARMLLEASDGARRIGDGVRQALEADLRDDLAAAPMPVGLIWGCADRVVPFGGLDALRALRPDMTVETLDGTGHIPQVEDPAAFVAALERLLAAM
jgi:pyruvate dehydrogenase E2 component (dihydrolipoamide acetyltransferase)